jgi:hypothetical protein
MPRALLYAALIGLASAACRNPEAREPEAAAVADVARATAPPREPLPRQIYYDLMAFSWYARAEPLIFEQLSYLPAGAPTSIPLAKLLLAGNYQGVDFYVLRADQEPPDVVYVPVFEGYWLAFELSRQTNEHD